MPLTKKEVIRTPAGTRFPGPGIRLAAALSRLVAVLEPAEQDERRQAEVLPLGHLVPRETPLANSED